MQVDILRGPTTGDPVQNEELQDMETIDSAIFKDFDIVMFALVHVRLLEGEILAGCVARSTV